MRRSILIFILLVISNKNMYSASFDCTNSQTSIEKMICSDKSLSQIDEQLNGVYESTIEHLDDLTAEQIMLQHKNWTEKRNQCVNIECLRTVYDTRLLEVACEKSNIGSSRGATMCFGLMLEDIEKQLNIIEDQYVKKILPESYNPEYLKVVFEKERKLWVEYRNAHCELVGQVTGGSDGWKTAWDVDCKIEETKKRIDVLKNDWH